MRVSTRLVLCIMAGVISFTLPAVTAAGSEDSRPDHRSHPNSGSCGSTHGFYYEGQVTDARAHLRGVGSYITGYDPSLCTPQSAIGNSSTAWDMLAAQDSDGVDFDYAQTGYGNFGKDAGFNRPGFHTFVEWCTTCDIFGGGTDHLLVNFQSVGDDWHYTTWKEPGGNIHFIVHGDQVSKPYAGWTHWASSWQGQWAGETHYPNDDIVGQSTARVYFDNTETYNDNTTLWSALGGTVTTTQTANNGHFVRLPGEDFSIYSDPL